MVVQDFCRSGVVPIEQFRIAYRKSSVCCLVGFQQFDHLLPNTVPVFREVVPFFASVWRNEESEIIVDQTLDDRTDELKSIFSLHVFFVQFGNLFAQVFCQFLVVRRDHNDMVPNVSQRSVVCLSL